MKKPFQKKRPGSVECLYKIEILYPGTRFFYSSFLDGFYSMYQPHSLTEW